MKAIALGILSSVFFAFTFIFNRSMALEQADWAWTAALRFLFMIPILLFFVGLKGKLGVSLLHLRQHWQAYVCWSAMGFGVFYAFLCWGSAFGEGWLVAGIWESTIIAGPLLSPLFKETRIINGNKVSCPGKIPWCAMRWSLLIIFGIALMQWSQAHVTPFVQTLQCTIPVIIAAFAYPLGNRKLMEICQDDIDAFQRVLNMSIAGLPCWLLLSGIGWYRSGLPGQLQLFQSFLVAVFAGTIATVLFFAATNMVRENLAQLAAVEATQSGELLFTFIGELVWFNAQTPSPIAIFGVVFVMVGIIFHCMGSLIKQYIVRSTRRIFFIIKNRI